MQCRGGISLVIIAMVLLSLISGITVMYTQQRVEDYLVFTTTAEEANAVFGRQRVWLMSSVCMIDDYDGLEFILYTGDCEETPIGRRELLPFNDSTTTDRHVGYYFSFLANSTVDVAYYGQSAISKWRKSKNPKEAEDFALDCDGTEFQHHLDSDDGYYYICIIPPRSVAVDYRINVTQRYHERKIKKECKEPYKETHKCCYFDFAESFSHLHCVYLAVHSSKPTPLHTPHKVKVYMQYNETVRACTIALFVVATLASCVVIVAVYCVQFRVRRP